MKNAVGKSIVLCEFTEREAKWLMLAAEVFEEDDYWPEKPSDKRVFREGLRKLQYANKNGRTP